MKKINFDPFRNRLARDIRNSLAKAFLDALVEQKSTRFRTKASEFLKQDLEQTYNDYVKIRLYRYEELFSNILEQSVTDRLQQAGLFWQHRLYFEMHELLEKPWKEATGPRRMALQGLIRAAGMKIHAENGNTTAAISIAVKAQDQLQKYGKELAGFDLLASVMDEIGQTLNTFQSEEDYRETADPNNFSESN